MDIMQWWWIIVMCFLVFTFFISVIHSLMDEDLEIAVKLMILFVILSCIISVIAKIL